MWGIMARVRQLQMYMLAVSSRPFLEGLFRFATGLLRYWFVLIIYTYTVENIIILSLSTPARTRHFKK
jgi:hypothetical protein